MERPPVLTKHDFVRRYIKGEFGNASPSWNTFDEYYVSGYARPVHVRNRVAGGKTWYNCSREWVVKYWYSLAAMCGECNLYISAMCPTERTLFQGELVQSPNGLALTYTRVAKPMREALRESTRNVVGVVSWLLLRRYLCPNSFEWLCFLLDAYPKHVVEFSTFDKEWGTLPGYNTVFWEVRLY